MSIIVKEGVEVIKADGSAGNQEKEELDKERIFDEEDVVVDPTGSRGPAPGFVSDFNVPAGKLGVRGFYGFLDGENRTLFAHEDNVELK